MDEQKHFLVMRPRLAERLLAEGVPGHRTPNPYNPDRKCWAFEPTRTAWEVLTVFYGELGLTVPAGTARQFDR